MSVPPDDPHDPDADDTQIAEMVAATSEPIRLGKEPTHLTLAIHEPTGPASLRIGPRKVYLKVENITSDRMAPSYDVYLNLPAGEDPKSHPERQIGVLAMFGLVEYSQPRRNHAGDGLTYSLAATRVILTLRAIDDWDPGALRISFFPGIWDDDVEVQVGRVSLYYQ